MGKGTPFSWMYGMPALAALLMGSGCGSDTSTGDVPGGVVGMPGGAGGAAAGGMGGSGIAGTAAGVGGTPPVGGQPGTAGTAGPSAGTGVMMAGTGGPDPAGTDGGGGTGNAGSGGMEGGAGSAGSAGGSMPPPEGACTPAPSGSFQTMAVTGTGPDGNYTIFRPRTLGEGGFLHPPVAWGNGLGTTPSLYTAQLNDVASHGFVVIANPGTGSNPQVVRQGLEWLLAQNASGDYAGKLAVDCAGTIGYSMGGGAAVGSGSHPAVKAIVSIHGLQDAADRASGPILLLTAEGDTFVTKSGFVEPCYNRSSVQPTILASHSGGDHLDPLGANEDWQALVAWLRFWIYGDQAQRDWFFGDNCKLCSWPDFRRKNHPEWN